MTSNLVLSIAAIASVGAGVDTAGIPAGPTSESITYLATIEGHSLSFEIGEADLTDSPQWAAPEFLAPPMPAADAVRIARDELAKYVVNPADWALKEIALRSLGRARKWFYTVSWRPPKAGYVGDDLEIPVLMNGKAVVAKRSKAPPDSRPSVNH